MSPSDAAAFLSGLPVATIFSFPDPLVVLSDRGDGPVISQWLVPGVAKPTDEQWQTALAASDPSPSQERLRAAVVSACRAAASAVLGQIYSDPVHQAAGQNAAMIAAVSNGAPAAGSPFAPAFDAYAALYGITPAALATLALTLTSQSLVLSAALIAVEAAVESASDATALETALAAFETTVGEVVAAVNAASPPAPLVAPPAILIPGVNA